MVKNIFITFSILLSISLMFFISLSNGIRLGDFSYENISVKGLYLKYDEKIIIDTQNVLIYNQQRTKSTEFRIKFSIEEFFDQYFIHVENFFLKEPFLKVSGDIVLDLEEINLDTISQLYFNNFSIQFSRNLKPVHAQKCFVEYENNSFYFSFLNPKYGAVSIDGSSVEINNYDHVLLNIQSKEKLSNEVLELLSNYKVDVPIKQIEGTNKTEVKVKLPFDIKKDIDVHSKIDLANGKILLYDIPLYVNSMQLQLDNNILQGEGKLIKTIDEKGSLSYNIDSKFEIDFKKKQVEGGFFIKEGLFESISTKEMEGNFILDFNKEFLSDITLQKDSFLTIKEQPFIIEHFISNYQNSNTTFFSNIQLKHATDKLTLKVLDQFNLKTLQSSGSFDLEFQNETSFVEVKEASYNSSFKEKFYLTLYDTDAFVQHEDAKITIENFKGSFFDNKLHGNLINTDLKNSKLELVFKTIDIILNDIDDIQLSIPSFQSLKTELAVDIQDIDIDIKKQKANYSSVIDKKHLLKGEIDLERGDIKGVLDYEDELIAFNGNIFDPITINAPKLEFTYKESSDEAYALKINKTPFLKHFFKYLSFDKTSRIFVKKTDNENPTFIDLNNINIDILTLEDEKKDVPQDKLLNANINWKNSSFSIGNYTFPFQKAKVKLSSGMTSANILLTDNSRIDIKKDIHELVLVSTNLTSEYVNDIFQKNYFKDGTFEMFLTRKTIDTYEGTIKIHGVTFKEMQFVDNLLLFVNSSPALINPLLALPTVFRFGMNGFKIDGYHVVEGSFNFIYHKAKNILDLNSIKTLGNINNFSGDISVNLNDDSIKGKLNVAFLKDFATLLQNIPVLGEKALNKDGDLALPINISGTTKDPEFSVDRD